MTYTPEKVAELVSKLRDHAPTMRWLGEVADVLKVVADERDRQHEDHVRRWSNVIKANGALIDRLEAAESERDAAMRGQKGKEGHGHG